MRRTLALMESGLISRMSTTHTTRSWRFSTLMYSENTVVTSVSETFHENFT